MIKGTCGGHTLSVEFQKELKGEDGCELVGLCSHKSQQGHIQIVLDSESSGIGLLDTFLHEAGHAAEYVFGLDVDHQVIYTMAAAFTQILLSTGLVTPEEFEARFRRLMLENERKEGT